MNCLRSRSRAATYYERSISTDPQRQARPPWERSSEGTRLLGAELTVAYRQSGPTRMRNALVSTSRPGLSRGQVESSVILTREIRLNENPADRKCV